MRITTPEGGLSIEETPTSTRQPFSDPIETQPGEVTKTVLPTATGTGAPATPTRKAWPTETEPATSPTPSPTMTEELSEETPTETRQPSPTATRTPTADDAFQFEVIEGTPTPTATHTATLIPSPTGEVTETTLPSPTATHTATQTATLSEVTATHTATLTETATATITATATLTPTMTASLTPDELPQLDAVNTVFSGATYDYDGDGNMVKSTVNGVTTYYVGGHYQLEVDGATETETKYYTGPTGRFAMRVEGVLYWIFSDHLQSSSVILEEDGDTDSRTTYTAFGEERKTVGSSPTDYTYTGQRSYAGDFGLMFYNARWYDPASAHFTSADTIVPQPGNSGDWDRYAYVLNNPINFNDPTGHDDEGVPLLEGQTPEYWEWIHKINSEFDFVTVEGNAGVTYPIVGNWVETSATWTVEELKLLYDTLSNFKLMEEIDKNVLFVRLNQDVKSYHLDSSNYSFFIIFITDKAWHTPPSGGIGYGLGNLHSYIAQETGSGVAQYFQGTISHELTHAAVACNSQLLNAWATDPVNESWNKKSLFLGLHYGMKGLDPDEKLEELFAMYVSSCEYGSLFTSFPSWRTWYEEYGK